MTNDQTRAEAARSQPRAEYSVSTQPCWMRAGYGFKNSRFVIQTFVIRI
jgi:hypothetical protein